MGGLQQIILGILSSSFLWMALEMVLAADTQVTGPQNLCKSGRFCGQNTTGFSLVLVSCPPLPLRPLSSVGNNRKKDLNEN